MDYKSKAMKFGIRDLLALTVGAAISIVILQSIYWDPPAQKESDFDRAMKVIVEKAIANEKTRRGGVVILPPRGIEPQFAY